MGKKVTLWGRLFLILLCISIVALSGCDSKKKDDTQPANQDGSERLWERKTVDKTNMDLSTMSVDEIVSMLTLDEMTAQMLQPANYHINESMMQQKGYGSILSVYDYWNADQWKQYITNMQKACLKSTAKIPYIYGQDDVHGVNYASGTVIFPHNIGVGAANDEELTYQMGQAVADEAKLCGMLLNFAPCVAVATDPRWGRTYESYSSDVTMVGKLSDAYTRGLLDGKLVVCPKHYFGDGNVAFGTGEDDRLIDRGDSKLSSDQIDRLLSVYQKLIDDGAQVIMLSHSSLNGVKMHENEEYINKLRNELGFQGMILSDWESIQHISGSSYADKIIKAVNAGVDMLMEPEQFQECQSILIKAVKEGTISEDRIKDAVTRIIQVKIDAGILKDPMQEHIETKQSQTGSDEYKKLAQKLVEESLVLLKNDNHVLPIKNGAKVYLTGPAANNCKAQCGGWTREWGGNAEITDCTTIKSALEAVAKDNNIEIITDPKRASEADVTLLCVGEEAYAEWTGDTSDLSLTGTMGLSGNKDAIEEASKLRNEKQIPTITCILAGRHVLIKDYIDQWDSAVMCYLPGTEGSGVVNGLLGKSAFTGKLPMPWYETVDQINNSIESGNVNEYQKDTTASSQTGCMFPTGYGLQE